MHIALKQKSSTIHVNLHCHSHNPNPGSGRSFMGHVLKFPVTLSSWGTYNPAKLNVLTFKFLGGKIILTVCVSLQRPLGHLPRGIWYLQNCEEESSFWGFLLESLTARSIYTAVQGKLSPSSTQCLLWPLPGSEYRDIHLSWARPALCYYSTSHGNAVYPIYHLSQTFLRCQMNSHSSWLYSVLH